MNGKTVLITGASSGIGEAIAAELAELTNGNIKLILVSRSIEAPPIKAQLHIAKWDVSKCSSRDLIDSLPEEFKDINVLVNCAGLALGKDRIGSLDLEDVGNVYATNVLGLIDLTNTLVPHFIEKGRGDIVMIGSIASNETTAGNSLYSSSKAAVLAFTHSLRKELINTKIRVIEIDPGMVQTNFAYTRHKGQDNLARDQYNRLEPLNPEDVAELVGFVLTRNQNVVIAESRIVPLAQASMNDVYSNK